MEKGGPAAHLEPIQWLGTMGRVLQVGTWSLGSWWGYRLVVLRKWRSSLKTIDSCIYVLVKILSSKGLVQWQLHRKGGQIVGWCEGVVVCLVFFHTLQKSNRGDNASVELAFAIAEASKKHRSIPDSWLALHPEVSSGWGTCGGALWIIPSGLVLFDGGVCGTKPSIWIQRRGNG